MDMNQPPLNDDMQKLLKLKALQNLQNTQGVPPNSQQMPGAQQMDANTMNATAQDASAPPATQMADNGKVPAFFNSLRNSFGNATSPQNPIVAAIPDGPKADPSAQPVGGAMQDTVQGKDRMKQLQDLLDQASKE